MNVHGTGPTIDELVIGDEPGDWARAGFLVDPDGRCRIGRVRLHLVGRDQGRRLSSWSLRDLAARAGLVDDGIDGLATTVSTQSPPEPADHPIGARHIDHVVVASPDAARTTQALEAVGFTARRVRHTDSYGAPMSQTFFRAGEVIIEVVAPADDRDVDPAAVHQPASFFGLAITVADLDAAAGRLGPALGDLKDAVQPGRRIATLRHRDLGLSVATALMSPAAG